MRSGSYKPWRPLRTMWWGMWCGVCVLMGTFAEENANMRTIDDALRKLKALSDAQSRDIELNKDIEIWLLRLLLVGLPVIVVFLVVWSCVTYVVPGLQSLVEEWIINMMGQYSAADPDNSAGEGKGGLESSWVPPYSDCQELPMV
ncbi:hypothetical protein GJAV_G00084490 [Gymnothorax javanicus]|nr:hypothetical protein GJAV_G00084490 [Gymnothorax javanicus]